MPRVYLPLLPLPVLAVLVAVSACTKPKTEEVSHLIPPPALAAAVLPDVTAAAKAPPAPGLDARDEAPSAEEVKAFERPVRK